MKYVHTMVRVSNLDQSLAFHCSALGLQEVARFEVDVRRLNLVNSHAPEDLATATTTRSPTLELTYNWDTEPYSDGRNFGHIASSVNHIHTVCKRLMDHGGTINRLPCDGKLAFVRSPDNIAIELVQSGSPLPPDDLWASMPNVGFW